MQEYRAMKYNLHVKITQEGGTFIATCPEWSDCYAQGETLQEALAEINYVASELLSLYAEEGLKVPLTEMKEIISQQQVLQVDLPVVTAQVAHA